MSSLRCCSRFHTLLEPHLCALHVLKCGHLKWIKMPHNTLKWLNCMTCLSFVCVLNIYPPLPSIWGLVHLCQNAQYGTLKMFPLAKTQIWKGFCSSLASSVNWRGPYETSLRKYFVCLCVWECVCVCVSVVCLTDRNDKRMHFGLLEGKQQLFFTNSFKKPV